MKMAVESMEMAPGAIFRPDRVPEQRLLSPESCLRRRRRYGTFRGFLIGYLGFSTRRHLIGEEATRGGARGAHTTPRSGLARPGPRLGSTKMGFSGAYGLGLGRILGPELLE